MWSTLSLPLLPGKLSLGVVLPVMVPFMSQRELVSWVWYKIIWWWGVPVLELWEMWSNHSLPLLPGKLSLGVVLPVMVPFMSQRELVSWVWYKTIWWWGSSPGALGNVEYTFIAITPRSTLTRNGCTYYGHIYRSNWTIWLFTIHETLELWYSSSILSRIRTEKRRGLYLWLLCHINF